jgi:hypothetical protein
MGGTLMLPARCADGALPQLVGSFGWGMSGVSVGFVTFGELVRARSGSL